MELMNGNKAAAYISYFFSEIASTYPITPSSLMAEYVEKWKTAGKHNLFEESLLISNANSEATAISILHGALKTGALATTYTSSQGLLLMIPTMYRIAGELLPTVIHVASRSITTNGQSILSDYSDVMSTRQTGFAILAAGSVQEVMDLGAVAHLSTISASVPFLHFFDGFQTSHQLNVVKKLERSELLALIDKRALEHFRRRALNPNKPRITGVNQNSDIHFEYREAINSYYDAALNITREYMKKINAIQKTDYDLVNYYGDPKAQVIIVAMGAVTITIENTIDYLKSKGEKVGYLNVRLYRPFPAQVFLEKLPKTVKKIAVLDRTKENGASGEPLFLDVVHTTKQLKNQPLIIGGRYGLGGKNVTIAHINGVYEHLKQSSNKIKEEFTIGINDDITNLSLEISPPLNDKAPSYKVAKFFGIGSDGTIGKTKKLAKMIFEETGNYVQVMVEYSAHKTGGLTMSQLRYGPKPIKDNHIADTADFIEYSDKAKLYEGKQKSSCSVGDLMKLGFIDGTFPACHLKTKPSNMIKNFPKWHEKECRMCNLCAFICPHSAIRPVIVNDNEIKDAPPAYTFKKLEGKSSDYYRIQIIPHNCTECGLCVAECPKKQQALTMQTRNTRTEIHNWLFSKNLLDKSEKFPRNTVFGSQMQKPLLEFPSSCAGCGETIYAKILTQLFGERMIIAGATGCSSIWAASHPKTPYTTNSKGQGPVWATSLLENNAEFGLGMQLATTKKREHVADKVKKALAQTTCSLSLKLALETWLIHKNENKGTQKRAEMLITELEIHKQQNLMLNEVYQERDYFSKPSHWLIGGDGWAYDIGFGGIDHVLTTNEDVNILVFDNENYANTGGQASKSTQAGTRIKSNITGKKSAKKDLGAYGITLGNVYVAQVTYSMNPKKLLQILTEAEQYSGPSLVIAYTPCIYHGISGGMKNSAKNARFAVECGYWANYHYDPSKDKKMIIDYPNPDFEKIPEYLRSQKRFNTIINSHFDKETELFKICEQGAKRRFEFIKMIAKLDG